MLEGDAAKIKRGAWDMAEGRLGMPESTGPDINSTLHSGPLKNEEVSC
jgi:hypothetical protein